MKFIYKNEKINNMWKEEANIEKRKRRDVCVKIVDGTNVACDKKPHTPNLSFASGSDGIVFIFILISMMSMEYDNFIRKWDGKHCEL